MLPEIAADVLLFLDRYALDRLSLVGSWLNELIEKTCAKYPLRRLSMVDIYKNTRNPDVYVSQESAVNHMYNFPSLMAALPYVAAIFRQSYIEWLAINFAGHGQPKFRITSNNWSILMDSIDAGAVTTFSCSARTLLMSLQMRWWS